MWVAGGQVNTARGLEIIKEKEFQEFADEYFLHSRFPPMMLPPLSSSIPQTAAEWISFITQREKLVLVLEDTVEETVKSSSLPTPALCGKIMKRLEDAERFDEAELEALEDDIDIEVLNDVHDPTQVPGESEVGCGAIVYRL